MDKKYELGCEACGMEYAISCHEEFDRPEICPFCGHEVEIPDEFQIEEIDLDD